MAIARRGVLIEPVPWLHNRAWVRHGGRLPAKFHQSLQEERKGPLFCSYRAFTIRLRPWDFTERTIYLPESNRGIAHPATSLRSARVLSYVVL